MTGLVAYLTLVIVVPALLLGHQGQDWPPGLWWRTWRRRRTREPPRRHIPHWARTQPIEAGDARTQAPKRSTNFLSTRKDHS